MNFLPPFYLSAVTTVITELLALLKSLVWAPIYLQIVQKLFYLGTYSILSVQYQLSLHNLILKNLKRIQERPGSPISSSSMYGMYCANCEWPLQHNNGRRDAQERVRRRGDRFEIRTFFIRTLWLCRRPPGAHALTRQMRQMK